jgi:hypothetical protein
MANGPSESTRADGIRKSIGYLLLCAGFAVASLLSGALLRLGDDIAGAHASPPGVQAAFVQPGRVARGVVPGQVVPVAVTGLVGPVSAISANCGRTPVATRPQRAGSGQQRVLIDVPEACAHAWLTVHIPSLAQPLRAWVR